MTRSPRHIDWQKVREDMDSRPPVHTWEEISRQITSQPAPHKPKLNPLIYILMSLTLVLSLGWWLTANLPSPAVQPKVQPSTLSPGTVLAAKPEVIPQASSQIRTVNQKPLSAIPVPIATYRLATHGSGKPETNKMHGTEILNLDTATLEKLGFQFNPEGFEYANSMLHAVKIDKMTITLFTEEGEKGYMIIYGNNNQIGIRTEQRYDPNQPKKPFYPLFVTDAWGSQELKYKFDVEDEEVFTDAYFAKMAGTLVPVGIQLKYENKLRQLVFWFTGTPELFAQLPASIGKPMQAEAIALQQNSSAKEDTTGAENGKSATQGEPAAGCRFFNACQASLEKRIELSMYPNPASDKVNLSFTLSEGLSGQFSLCDIQGKAINAPQPLQGNGRSQFISMDVSTVKPGLYLLMMDLAGQGQIMKRLIIAR